MIEALFGSPSRYFAPSALGTEVNLSWAVGPGFYISRPWRCDARFLVDASSREEEITILDEEQETDCLKYQTQ